MVKSKNPTIEMMSEATTHCPNPGDDRAFILILTLYRRFREQGQRILNGQTGKGIKWLWQGIGWEPGSFQDFRADSDRCSLHTTHIDQNQVVRLEITLHKHHRAQGGSQPRFLF